MKRMAQDERDWLMGVYNFEAFTLAIGNAFRKKGSKPLEYRKTPILHEMKYSTDMSEHQKDIQRQLFVAKLQAMQTNFELNHPTADEESQSLPINNSMVDEAV